MSIDDMVGKAIDQMHEQQAIFPESDSYIAVILVNGTHHAEITITRKELENNGPELHPLVKRLLIENGVTEDHIND